MRPFARPCCTALLLAAGCATVPYQPLRRPMPPLVPGSWELALQVMSAHYPRLTVAEPDGFRIQSDWVRTEHRGHTGLQRATLFRDGDDLAVVVEMRYLSLGWGGEPHWSSAHGVPEVEHQLLDAVVDALASAAAANGHTPP